jgi:hypothetical protein
VTSEVAASEDELEEEDEKEEEEEEEEEEDDSATFLSDDATLNTLANAPDPNMHSRLSLSSLLLIIFELYRGMVTPPSFAQADSKQASQSSLSATSRK